MDGNAIVYCEGAFNTPEGKTAHGLVRFTERYNVLAVIDSKYAGQDAGKVLDGKKQKIPVVETLQQALDMAAKKEIQVSHFVIGLAPDGGRLPDAARKTVAEAIQAGLNVDSGLHDFLSEDENIAKLAQEKGVAIRDVRKPPHRKNLHFFTGKIEEVTAITIAVLGTDSAVGKRTTAWLIVQSLRRQGIPAELIGTGQTAWMQGAKYSLIMDSLINDFVSGEIENAVWSAWKDGARVIVIEGQGSLMNPAYPGGFEILAAGRPDQVVLQHAPMRLEYDGFPGYKLHSVSKQIKAIEMLSGKPVVAITVNHENMEGKEIKKACKKLTEKTGLPAWDVLVDGADALVAHLMNVARNQKTNKEATQ